MKKPNCAILIVSIILVSGALAQDSNKKEYVCPPCGHDCIKTVVGEPGTCGVCGMKLITKAEAIKVLESRASSMQNTVQAAGKQVAILIFEGVQIIDYTGPWEIFGHASFHVFTVAKNSDMINTAFGMKVTPHYTLKDHPKPDIILVPGGSVFATQNDPEVKKWLNQKSQDAEIVLSVCNGAYILAKAGLLNGLQATTTRSLIDGLANAGSNITVVHNTRYVDNGKVITSGGLSAGMDAALHVVERMHGKERAKRIAYGIEYDWRPDGVTTQR